MTMIWTRTQQGLDSRELPIEADRGAVQATVDEGCFVLAFRDGARRSHALLSRSATPIRVNGSRVVGGFRVLQHKDEIVIGAQRMFFSAESPPVVETYRHEGSARRPRCPVCRAEIHDGQSVVRCPGCARLYHQIDASDDRPAKPCWTYTTSCRFCEHPTSLSGEPTWRPDEQDL